MKLLETFRYNSFHLFPSLEPFHFVSFIFVWDWGDWGEDIFLIKLKQLLCWKQSILGSVVPLAMFYFFRPTLNTRCLAQMLRCLSLLTHLYHYASHVDILRSADISTFLFEPTVDCIWIVSSPLSLIIRNRDILLSSKRNTFANRCWVFFHFVTDKLLANFATFLQIVVWISHPWSIGPYWPGTTKY